MDIVRFSYDERENQATDDPIHLTNITGKLLDHLNEDCLLEIFSSLTPVDLCSLAETCKRFKPITQRLFPNEVEIKASEGFSIKLSSNGYPHLPIKLEIVECFLKNFGNRLSKLSVRRWDQPFIDLIANHYEAISLKHLDVRIFMYQIQDSVMRCWDFIFPYITRQLVVLDVNYSISTWVVSRISKHTFPNLERFTYRRNGRTYRTYHAAAMSASQAISNEVFLKFFNRHTRLTTLIYTEEGLPTYTPYASPVPRGRSSGYLTMNQDRHPQTFVKDSTNSGSLTLPSMPPEVIVMCTDPYEP